MFEIEPITKYLNLLHRLPWLHTKYLFCRHYSIHYLVYLVECRLKIKRLNHKLKAVERMTNVSRSRSVASLVNYTAPNGKLMKQNAEMKT